MKLRSTAFGFEFRVYIDDRASDLGFWVFCGTFSPRHESGSGVQGLRFRFHGTGRKGGNPLTTMDLFWHPCCNSSSQF